DVVRDQQRAAAIHGDTDRPAIGVMLIVEETGEDVFRRAARLAVRKRHIDHFVAAWRTAIPRTMLTDEGAATIMRAECVGGVERQTKRGSVRAERIIGHSRFA